MASAKSRRWCAATAFRQISSTLDCCATALQRQNTRGAARRISSAYTRAKMVDMWSRRRMLAMLGAGILGGRERATPVEAPSLFREVPAINSGIHWVHENGRSAEHWLPESMCSGCAFLDYDNDGWMDIFLVNTGPTS